MLILKEKRLLNKPPLVIFLMSIAKALAIITEDEEAAQFTELLQSQFKDVQGEIRINTKASQMHTLTIIDDRSLYPVSMLRLFDEWLILDVDLPTGARRFVNFGRPGYFWPVEFTYDELTDLDDLDTTFKRHNGTSVPNATMLAFVFLLCQLNGDLDKLSRHVSLDVTHVRQKIEAHVAQKQEKKKVTLVISLLDED